MANSMSAVVAALSVALASGCAAELGDGPTARLDEPAPAHTNEAWDEARAASASPCGDATVASCAAATHGACGVVSYDAIDTCAPLFNWGVVPDGRVQFGSSERLFFVDDLVAQPLSEGEVEEAAAAAWAIDSAEAVEAEPTHDDDGLEPLATINHGGSCSTTYRACFAADWLGGSRMERFASHFNSGGRHIHVLYVYANNSIPWYYCNAFGAFQSSWSMACGTP